ncbi:hypothetical protein AYL99_07963 [Fonsecaea erecta]|uniref:C2H2-type domain-containing protein n=1 Tax=Fonsecaea erecta TaxID=1367422 RepID=A0A178ZDT0_9EURO|nr:hypothetical protein AYL99_07963 [Fonsecaea erecta]OAP57225.1 hypothetical protein AYL99_07963 [Fonsecaea erecta]
MNNFSNSERRSTANNRYGTQASYRGDIPQPQYSNCGYDWAVQQQQSYSNSASQRTTYADGAWGSGRTQVAPRDDRRQQGQYAVQAVAGDGGSGHNYYNSIPSNKAGQNNSGLNNLAYSSGLDDAALQRHGHRQQHSTGMSGLSQSSATINRIRSPVTAHGTTSRFDPSQPPRYGYQNDLSSLSSQNQPNSLLGAAKSLVGNVSAHFQQTAAAMGGHVSASPVMEKSASQRSASPYYQPQNPKTQGQGYRPSTTPQTNHRGAISAASATQEKPRQVANTGLHRTGPGVEASQRPVQPQGQLVNSISNLVSPVEAASLEPASMPDYIDPTQVFNPFHKEHERRRREAEAEARRKAEEAAAKEKRENASAATKKRVQEVNLVAMATPTTSESNSKAEQPEAAQSAQKRPHSGSQPARQSDAVASEADMAAELKAMMEKMQEFRNKDPSLFQRLWDDMRKTPSVPSIAGPAQSPQISTQNTFPTDHSRPQASTSVDPAPPPKPGTSPLPTTTSATKTAKHLPDALSITPLGAKLNGYRVIVENNPEGLPDLGRFPAERRIRLSSQGKRSSETDATGQPTPIVLGSEQYIVPNPSKQQTPTRAIPSTEKPAPVSQGPLPKVNIDTIWAENKHNALAQVAVKFLMANPENAKIEITHQDIHQILEQDPSYTDLCLTLEKKGLKFHRSQFARQLLSEVPQLRGPSKTQALPAPPIPVLSRAPVQVSAAGASVAPARMPPGPLPIDASAPAPVPARTIDPSNMTQAVRIPVFPGRPAAPRSAQMPQSKPTRNYHQARPEPVTGSKEAMARKRDFSDIIDLTTLSDNEDYVMPKKQARAEGPSPEPTAALQEYQNLAQPVTSNLPPPTAPYIDAGFPPPLRFDPSLLQYPHGYVPLPHYRLHLQAPSSVAQPTPAPPPQRSLRLLAKPINKEEAFRKTYYNPKTVARDILIAAGRHPTERALNAHLAGLLGKFVEIDSDLSTFNWDAIDPEGPPVPQVEFVDVPTEAPRYRLGESGIRRRGQVLPEADTTAKRALPNSEKHLTPAPATAPAPAPAPVTATATATNQVVKARPLQPQSSSTARVATTPHTPPRSQEVSKATTKPVIPQKRPSSLISSNGSPNSERRQSTQSVSVQVPSTMESKRSSPGAFFPSGKRRGRPPGASNLHPSVEAMQKAAVQEPSPIEITIPSPAAPSLPVFKCRWRGCKAHLHNLQTLRNHVSNVHRPTPKQLEEEGGYICWWKRCKYLIDDGDGSLRPSEIFDNPKDWLKHIEEHTNEVASRMGDGPTTKIIGKPQTAASKPFDVSRFVFHFPVQPSTSFTRTLSHTDPQTLLRDKARYLSDEQGRITTPDVSVKSAQDDLEPDTMTLLKAKHNDWERYAQRSFMKTHRKEKSSSRALAEETLKAMAARKAKIGPGIDRGGCILVTEARRATLIQNPGIQRVVDGDY